MPQKKTLSEEAIRHIASGTIGIHAAKKLYGIGESRIHRIRQGLDTLDKHVEERSRDATTQTQSPPQTKPTQDIAKMQGRIAELGMLDKHVEERSRDATTQTQNPPQAKPRQDIAKMRERIAELESLLDAAKDLEAENSKLREDLAEAQGARLVAEEALPKVQHPKKKDKKK